MAIDFSDKILVTNPTTYVLGQGVSSVGIMTLIVGIITHFTGDIFLPAFAWCALAVPTMVIGGILVACGLTKR